MKTKTIRYSIAGFIIALTLAVTYAIIRLLVLAQRVDIWILFVNVIVFAFIAGFLMYLMKKDRETREEELFKD